MKERASFLVAKRLRLVPGLAAVATLAPIRTPLPRPAQDKETSVRQLHERSFLEVRVRQRQRIPVSRQSLDHNLVDSRILVDVVKQQEVRTAPHLVVLRLAEVRAGDKVLALRAEPQRPLPVAPDGRLRRISPVAIGARPRQAAGPRPRVSRIVREDAVHLAAMRSPERHLIVP